MAAVMALWPIWFWAMGDVALIPLVILTNAWATRKGLTYTAGSSEMTLAMDVHSA